MTALEINKRNIYIDPSYTAFNADKLFDLLDPVLNRDDQLLAATRLRESALQQGHVISTADKIPTSTDLQEGDYYSMGLRPNLDNLHAHNVRLRAYILMEPPIVAPGLYAALPEITSEFERCYVHNMHGDGYSLDGVNTDSLRKLYWPIPYQGVINPFWDKQERIRKTVVINSHHRPLGKGHELYSKRIEALAVFAKHGTADLYGHGWDKLLTKRNLWLPFLRHRSVLLKTYRGPCRSKYETLSNYTHCLCFENMRMDGYVTEKIFDCLYTGTIPLYLGADDIATYIPNDVFIDCRKFTHWEALIEYVQNMGANQIAIMREAGRAFMESDKILPYYHSLENIVLGALQQPR